MAIIGPQLNDQVEVITDDRGRHVPTGTKRNDLYNRAQGKYVVSVDVDDWISPDYVSEFLKATESDPDVITLEGWYTENGRNRVDWVIKLGEKYEARHENGKYMFFRFPNHLAAIRKSIATQVRFPDVWQGEDYAFALALKERNLLKTSVHIQKQLYHYAYLTNK